MPEIFPLLPPEEELALENSYAVLDAMDETGYTNDGSEVTVVDDSILGKPVVELLGPSACVVMSCSSSLRYLVLHLRNINKFMSLEVQLLDDSESYRTFHVSNGRSITTISNDLCEMPLHLGDHWQFVKLDLEDLTHCAFGTCYSSISRIKVWSSCRVGVMFLSDRIYSDAELPPFLRVLKTDKKNFYVI